MAYKISYMLVLIYCVLFRPAFAGVCYSGVAADTMLWLTYIFVSVIVFLSDLEKKKYGIINGMGAVCSLYFIWMTQNIQGITAALLLLLIYGIYWIIGIIRGSMRDKRDILFQTLGGIVLGAASIFLIRYLLYSVSPGIGMQITYRGEQIEYIERTAKDIIIDRDWKYVFYDQMLVLKEYIRRFNLSGYRYLTKFMGEQVWPCNSFVMNTYRYGILAGISYGIMQLLIICRAIKGIWQREDFLICGMGLGGIILGMLIPIEMPFLNAAWFGFYFILCWMIVSGESCEK